MFCPNCGRKCIPGAVYCSECGKRIPDMGGKNNGIGSEETFPEGNAVNPEDARKEDLEEIFLEEVNILLEEQQPPELTLREALSRRSRSRERKKVSAPEPDEEAAFVETVEDEIEAVKALLREPKKPELTVQEEIARRSPWTAGICRCPVCGSTDYTQKPKPPRLYRFPSLRSKMIALAGHLVSNTFYETYEYSCQSCGYIWEE